MPLPSAWVDRLFAKLAVTYGQRFLGLYSGLDLEAVKADWAHELDGLQNRPEAIKHALEHLPTDQPPTVLQFRALCRNAPTAHQALPSPKGAPDQRLMAKVKAAISRPEDPKEWARRLARKEHWQAMHPREVGSRERLTPVQRRFWREALGLQLDATPADALPELQAARHQGEAKEVEVAA